MSTEVHPFLQKISEIIEGINQGDLSAALRAVSDDFVRHDLTNLFIAKEIGSSEAKSFLESLMDTFQDLKFEIIDHFVGENHLTVNYKISGIHKGNLFGVPATEKFITFHGVNTYRFQGSKIAEAWQLWDWASVMQQIGKN